MPKLRPYGTVELALIDQCRFAMGMAPTSQNTIGVGQAPMDFEFDVPGATGLFPSFDDRNHEYRLPLYSHPLCRRHWKVWCCRWVSNLRPLPYQGKGAAGKPQKRWRQDLAGSGTFRDFTGVAS